MFMSRDSVSLLAGQIHFHMFGKKHQLSGIIIAIVDFRSNSITKRRHSAHRGRETRKKKRALWFLKICSTNLQQVYGFGDLFVLAVLCCFYQGRGVSVWVLLTKSLGRLLALFSLLQRRINGLKTDRHTTCIQC